MMTDVMEVHEEGSSPFAMTPQMLCCYLMYTYYVGW